MPWDHEKVDAAFDEGCQAIGEVVYFFQQLEDELRRVVSFLIEPTGDFVGDIVVVELSFKQLAMLAVLLTAA